MTRLPMTMARKTCLLFLSLFLAPLLGAVTLTFEEGIPSWLQARGGLVQTSSLVAKEGELSLLWDNKRGGELRLETPMGFEPRGKDATSNALAVFAFWIYNPKATDGSLQFTFSTGGTPAGSFSMGLDFKGWRTAWIRYERDLDRVPETDPDQLVIAAPEDTGRLFLDLIQTAVDVDARAPVPDAQVPFVGNAQARVSNNIWNDLLTYRNRERAALEESNGANTDAVRAVTEAWNEAFADLYRQPPPPALKEWRQRLREWRIERSDGLVTGRPVFFPSQRKLLAAGGIEPERWLRDFGRLFLDGARGWHATEGEEREEWEHWLLLMFDHLVEQGWVDGSGQGALHHLGYSVRELFRGLYAARELLASTGRLKTARDLMAWYSGTGRVFEEMVTHPSVDTYNTQLEGMLMSSLLHPSPEAQHRLLSGLGAWVEASLRPRAGIEPIFKEDGSFFHHQGHYPAYANGGLRGLGPVLFALANTPYAPGTEELGTLKKALLAYRFYSNIYHWPRSISGRHPNGTWELNEEAFYWISKAFPGGPDPDLAAAYLRLSRNEAHAARLRGDGFEAEAPPLGTLTMPWAGLTAHRRGNWLALVRGHSRYLWSHETYRGANLYGRYLSHGTLELLHRGNPVTPAASGFTLEGWDWYHLPGATNPVGDRDYLRADIRNLDDVSGFEEMLLSRETFNGGVTGPEGGMHGLSLHGHDKYGDDLRARKTVTFFGDWILCLGSGITAEQLPYPIHTTLFQVSLKTNPGAIEEPDAGGASMRWLRDPTGTLYALPGDQKVHYAAREQEAPDQKTDAMARGRFATAWIDHGVRPENGGYIYALRPNGGEPGRLPFTVLRRDPRAHVVAPGDGEIVYHALFQPQASLEVGKASPLLAVDRACLVRTERESPGRLRLSFVQPDLNLYRKDGDQWTGEGRQREVSIYSRPWQASASGPLTTRIHLRGRWQTEEGSNAVQRINATREGTLLEIRAEKGRAIHLQLYRK